MIFSAQTLSTPQLAASLRRSASLSLVFLLLLAGTAFAQAPSMADDEIPTFKSEVNVVNILFRVRDRRGTFVPHLTKDDFEITEDGDVQKIKFFSSTTELPLNVGVLIDSSRSQSGVLEMEKQLGGQFVTDVLQPQDMGFVVDFNLDAEIVQDLTHSASALKDAVNSVTLTVPDCPGIPGVRGPAYSSLTCRGGTVLYDAIYLAAQEKLKTTEGRKALLILSDGEDEGSKVKLREAIEAAQKADTVVYVLLTIDPEFYTWYSYRGDVEMKKICEETGGRMIVVNKDPNSLRDAFQQISAEMRTQYSIGYTPTNRLLDGSFRKIEIKNKQGYRVQARTGYYANPKVKPTISAAAPAPPGQ